MVLKEELEREKFVLETLGKRRGGKKKRKEKKKGGQISLKDNDDPSSAHSLPIHLYFVELVPGNDEFGIAVPLPQELRPLLYLGLLSPNFERLNVNPDPEHFDIDRRPLGREDALWRGLDVLQHARDRLSEMTGKVVRLETDEVRAEYAVEELLPQCKASEDF